MKLYIIPLIFMLLSCPVGANAAEDFVITPSGVLAEYRGNALEVEIPSGVREIGDYAFWGCKELDLTVGENVKLYSHSLPEKENLPDWLFGNVLINGEIKFIEKCLTNR